MARPRTKIVKDCESGAHALLTAVFNHFGTPTDVAEICSIDRRDVHNWEGRGKVSLDYLSHLVDRLNLKPEYGFFALNFIDSCLTRPEAQRPNWNTVVRAVCTELAIPNTIRDQILFLEPPKVPKTYRK